MKITKVYTEKYKWPKDKPIQNGKTTFMTLYGLETCQTMVERETALALEALQAGGFADISFLTYLAESLVSRRK